MWTASHTSTHAPVHNHDGDLIDFSDEPKLTPEEEWRQRILPKWSTLKDDPRIRQLILAGVPRAAQGELWWTALAPVNDEDSYERALQCASAMRERLEWDWDGSLRRNDPWLKELLVVAADVPRTLPDAQTRGELNGTVLHRLLDAFVCADADCAGSQPGSMYVQGLADVAAVLLLHGQSEWQAFGCLRALATRPLLRAMFALDRDVWDAISATFQMHLASNLPSLAAHFAELGLQHSFYLTEWLVPLWCRSLGPDASALALNLLLVEGDLALLRAALGVIAALAPRLEQCDDLPSCRALCSQGPCDLSLSAFRACVLSCALEPQLLHPLKPWL